MALYEDLAYGLFPPAKRIIPVFGSDRFEYFWEDEEGNIYFASPWDYLSKHGVDASQELLTAKPYNDTKTGQGQPRGDLPEKVYYFSLFNAEMQVCLGQELNKQKRMKVASINGLRLDFPVGPNASGGSTYALVMFGNNYDRSFPGGGVEPSSYIEPVDIEPEDDKKKCVVYTNVAGRNPYLDIIFSRSGTVYSIVPGFEGSRPDVHTFEDYQRDETIVDIDVDVDILGEDVRR